MKTFKVVDSAPEVQEHHPAEDRATAAAGTPAIGTGDPLLSAEAAADYLGLTATNKHPGEAVRHLCRTRRLAFARLCGKVMVRRSELDRYVADNTVPAVPRTGATIR